VTPDARFDNHSSHLTGSLAGLSLRALPTGAPVSVFSVDVEDWYHSNFRSAPAPDGAGLVRRVEEGVENVLLILEAANAKATFFVLGCVAQDHPELVAAIARAGHEIGCHGMHHALVYEQSPDEFRRSIGEARQLLRDQSGQRVLGFRAPSWSITEKCLWAFEILADCGFRYDSSVFPVANYLYGVDDAPTAPYAIAAGDREIIELPPSVLKLGPVRFGVGGGFYLRVLPTVVHRYGRRSYANSGAPFLCYVHPREFDPVAWTLKLELNPAEAMIHRFQISRVRGRVAALLSEGRWSSFSDVLVGRGWLEEPT
jgi:polysaccharide deacetylase family protein (PEP-CTERM system associated)